MRFIFGIQINTEVFHKLIQLSFWVCNKMCPKYANKKLAYLCNVSQKSIGDEVDFLPAEKYESFLQVDSITLSLCRQLCPKYLKQEVYYFSAISSRIE